MEERRDNKRKERGVLRRKGKRYCEGKGRNVKGLRGTKGKGEGYVLGVYKEGKGRNIMGKEEKGEWDKGKGYKLEWRGRSIKGEGEDYLRGREGYLRGVLKGKSKRY